MIDQLATILLGVGLLLAFLAATQVVRVMPAPSGAGDLEPALHESQHRSLRLRIQRWLHETELDWDLRDFLTWTIAVVTMLSLVAVTLETPLVWFVLSLLAALSSLVVLLSVRRSTRLAQFRSQFPEIISVMARAIRAGLSVEEAFRLGEESAQGRLRRELGKCASQISMGRSLPSALESFAARSGLREVGLLATILSVHQGTGGPLAEALERLSLLLRDQLMFRQQVLAATSGGRFSAFVIAPAAPLLFLFLLLVAPEHVSLFFDRPLGRTFLVFGATLNVLGVLWIYYLVKPRH